MNQSSGTGRRWRLAGAFAMLVLAGTSALGLGSSAFADAENIRNVAQNKWMAIGDSAGAGAVSGPAITTNVAGIPQINVQVIAGDQATKDNSTQTATNTLNLNQDAAAASGDSTAEDGSVAVAGAATARNLAVGYQLNVQVIAGIGCDVDQVASNTANLDQTAAAASGDAMASEGGTATSGTAAASNLAVIKQRNVQVYVCKGGATGEQVAENVGDFSQTSAAATGTADATGGSASTGGATSNSQLRETQTNRQISGQ